MPTLPSGLKLMIDRGHILEPKKEWFETPENHFWYWSPAPENLPPFTKDDVWEAELASAPVPTSREEMTGYIRVCIGTDDGMAFWRGEMISDFPKYEKLSEEDLLAWKDWLVMQRTIDFVDETIEKCREQAEVNKTATGYAVFSSEEIVEKDD